ncbi:hypothetical protein HJFPF1_10273 [Paramyrothecium foliicola]|nr:hypothetical protein HJFPF1_10273 [Paramyrothecium foliicola]
MSSMMRIVLLIAVLRPCLSQGPTPIYIDLVSGYDELSSCAEFPLSTIVRDMDQACKDDSQLTSYSCFCTESFNRVGWDISTAVRRSCSTDQEEQATKAVKVFSEYCDSGEMQLSTRTDAATDSKWSYNDLPRVHADDFSPNDVEEHTR